EDLAAARLDGAARKIERRLPNLRRDLVEGQAIAAKRVLRDLDADLVRTRVPQRHVAYAGERRDLVPDLLRDRAQTLLVGVARDRDVDDLPPDDELLDLRLLRLFGERVDPVDAASHLIDETRSVGVLEHLDEDRADTLASLRADAFDVGEAIDRLFDPHADRLFHLRRRRAGKRDGDRDRVRFELRE